MEANVPLTPKRVRREIAKVLPGFVSHTKFFNSFAGEFTPVAVNAADKCRLVSKIDQIKGQPEKEVRAVVRDWKESAIVREVRTYGNGETFVRFEVRIRFTEGGPLDSEPHMLMLALSPRGKVRRYTIVFGTGRSRDGVKIVMSRHRGWDRTSDSFADLRAFIATMKADDFFIVEGGKGPIPFFQAWCDKSGDGGVFTTEYALIAYSWHFSTKNLLRRADLLQLVDRFEKGGFRELADAADWGQLPVEEMKNNTTNNTNKEKES